VNVSPEEPWVKVSQDRALARKRVGRLIYAAAGNKYSVLAFLETCRQVFVEAWHLYYRQNVLCLEDAAHLFWFLRDIGISRRNQIVAIRCDFDLGATFAFDRSISDMPTRVARDLLQTCVGLKRLHFFVNNEMYHEKRPFKKFRGLEDVQIDQRGNQVFPVHLERAHCWKRALMRPREVNPEETVEWWLHKNKSWYEHEGLDKKAEILKRLETVLKRTRLITPLSLIEGERMRDQGWDNDSEDDDEADMLRSLYEDEDQEEWVEVIIDADGVSAG
jgi:hypothetical protein